MSASAGGVVMAVLVGEPEAAVLVMPWAVLLVLGFSSPRRDAIGVEVEAQDDRMLIDDNVEITTTVAGAAGTAIVSALPSEAFWRDRPGDEAAEFARVQDALTSEISTVAISLTAEQWGVHDVGHVDVEITEPYGLFRYTARANEPRYVRVHPTETDIRNLLTPWLVRRVTGAHQSTAVGRGVEYADIRPYGSGDSLREINWKATARSEDVWVSQRHPDRATDVMLLLDSFVESGHDVRTVFGLAIEGAMALADSHLGVADRVGLAELGGNVRWVSPGAGSHQLQRLSDTLISTGLHSHVAERNLTLLLSRALPPRSFVVALTPLLDDRFIDALFILAGHGHDVAVIECQAKTGSPDDVVDVTSELALRLWDAERQMIRDRLAEHGVAVARWRQGEHLDLTLDQLMRRRRRAVRGRRR